jgi:hypothetical protein
MTTKQLASGTIAGGVVFFVTGYLLWGLAFAGFFETNTVGPAGLMKEAPDFLMLGIGQLLFGGLLTVIFGQWASISTAAGGAKAGAIIGLLVGFGIDLTLFGTMNLFSFTATVVDALLVAVQTAIAGAVVGAVLGMTKESGGAAAPAM